jgi:hypothetical protein
MRPVADRLSEQIATVGHVPTHMSPELQGDGQADSATVSADCDLARFFKRHSNRFRDIAIARLPWRAAVD